MRQAPDEAIIEATSKTTEASTPQDTCIRKLIGIATWACVGLILLRFLFYFEIKIVLTPFLSWTVDLFLFPVAVALFVVSAVGIARRSRNRAVVASICLVLCSVICWATPYGLLLGASFRLLRHESTYEREIAAVQAGGAAVAARVEPGPPERVAFSWGGILDNWVGIVHDPTHTAADLEQSRLWFGGVMLEARPLWGDWYLCRFT